jgi:iron complex outermembrane receptor protein
MLQKHTLLFGFCVAVVTTTVSTSAQAQTIDYGSLQSLFGEPVTTSATGQPQRVSDAPATMQIITADDIRRSGGTTIPEIIGLRSNLSVWQWTRSTADVNVRGNNQALSPQLLVLVNGREVYSDAYGNTNWQTIPVQLNEIRQIEIVEGPNSALFGFNAVSGVINIITYNPLYDNVSNASVRVGTNNYQEGSYVQSVKVNDKVGIRVSAGGTQMNEFDDAQAGTSSFYDPRKYEISLDSVAQLTTDSQLRIEATKTYAKTTEYPFIYAPYNTKYDTNSAKGTYIINTDLGIVQASAYRNWQSLNSVGATSVGFKNDVTVAQLEDLFKIGSDHLFRVQTEYRHNTLHGSLLSDGAEISYDVYAASGMWNWKIRSDLAWTNAARVDNLQLERSGPILANPVVPNNDAFDQSLTELSYNSGLVWNATNQDTFRLMTGRGIQAPSLLDFGLDLPSGPVIAEGNPNLKAGIVTNYEIGYDRKIKEIGGGFRSNIFYQRTTDIKGPGALLTGFVSQTGDIGSSDSVGLELGLHGAPAEHWTWDTQYTLQQANDDLTVNQGGIISVPYNGADATPLHTVTAHVGYTNGAWETDAYAKYVSSYEVLQAAGFLYTPVNAGDNIGLAGRIGYKITPHLTAALSGQQLNHTDVRMTSGPGVERQAFLTLTASF